MWPAQGNLANALGMVLTMDTSLRMSALTRRPLPPPNKAFKATSGSAKVALMPQIEGDCPPLFVR